MLDDKRVYAWCPFCGHFTEREPTPEQLEQLNKSKSVHWIVVVQEHADCVNHEY